MGLEKFADITKQTIRPNKYDDMNLSVIYAEIGNMKFKYGDIIQLKDGAKPQMSLDVETFFSLPDDEKAQVKTYWGLPEEAFEIDDMGYVYLKSEYAKRLYWGVDDVTRIDNEYDRLNINVAYDPQGVVNVGAFCSFIDEEDIESC